MLNRIGLCYDFLSWRRPSRSSGAKISKYHDPLTPDAHSLRTFNKGQYVCHCCILSRYIFSEK